MVRILKKCRRPLIGTLLVIFVLGGGMGAGVRALGDETAVVENAVLYQINEAGELEYNVTYSAPISCDAAVIGGAADLEALAEGLGTADRPEPVPGTGVGERTLGSHAYYADLTISGGEITKIEVAAVLPRPVIGISWRSLPLNDEYERMAEALERNGAYAVYLPWLGSAEQARETLSGIDGVFVTGGEDWNPALYGESAYPHGAYDWNDFRDISDLHLLQQAVAMDKPMLCVCRGAQGLNVAMGGALIQDIPTYLGQKVQAGQIVAERAALIEDAGIGEGSKHMDCQQPHYRVWVDGLVHTGDYHVLAAGKGDAGGAAIDVGSKLYEILGAEELAAVSTSHHQAIDPDRLGRDLKVTAVSSDGMVEAVEHTAAAFVLAVQWHPERDALGDSAAAAEAGVDVDQDSCNALLRALAETARARRSE